MTYETCDLCPRACGVDRTRGERGACRMTSRLVLARAALHYWEEPCISGTAGSGTVFFSGCPLGCVYCQNHEIADGSHGLAVDDGRLEEIFFELRDAGAHNINLVTPTHFAPTVAKAIRRARDAGFALPFVCNTSGYESTETLRALDGLIDIYLTDLRYARPATAAAYSHAPDYPAVARTALAEMVRQTGAATFDERGLMTRGTIVRILLLPGHLSRQHLSKFPDSLPRVCADSDHRPIRMQSANPLQACRTLLSAQTVCLCTYQNKRNPLSHNSDKYIQILIRDLLHLLPMFCTSPAQIHHHQCHIRLWKDLQALLHTLFSQITLIVQSGSIDQQTRPERQDFHRFFHGICRRPADLRHHRQILASHSIDQTGFAGIGPSEDRNMAAVSPHRIRQAHRIWPSPEIRYLVVVISSSPIGPLACNFCVEIPISAPSPNSPPSVNLVEQFT